jgi:hypothetical protein
MSNEKRYTAKQVTEAVLAKAGELIKKFPGLKKYESENSKKLGTQAPHRHQDAIDEEDIMGKRRVRTQQDPDKNPKENAEGNNAAPGARPYNVKKYGMEGQVRKAEAGMHKVEYHSADLEKRQGGLHPRHKYDSLRSKVPGMFSSMANKDYAPEAKAQAKELHADKLDSIKSQPKPNLPKSEEGMAKAEDKKDKMGMSVRQHLIDKVHHSMKSHGYKTHEASPNQFKEHAHNIGIKNLNGHEIVHGSDTYQHDGAEMKKDATDAIQHGINTMTGGQSQSAPQPSAGVAASLGSAFGKSEELKKDFGQNFANAAASGSITPAKIAQGAQSIAGPSPTPAPAKKSEAPAGKSIGSAKLAKFMEYKASKRLKKS